MKAFARLGRIPLVALACMGVAYGADTATNAPSQPPAAPGQTTEPAANSNGQSATPTLSAPVAAAPAANPGQIAAGGPLVSSQAQEVVKLRDTGIQNTVIRAYIDNSKYIQPPSADEIIYLHEHGVAPDLIAAYIQRAGQLRPQGVAAPPAPEAPVPQVQETPIPAMPPAVSVPSYTPDYGAQYYAPSYYPYDYSYAGYPYSYSYPYLNYGYSPYWWWNSYYGYPLIYSSYPFGRFHGRFDRDDRFGHFGGRSFAGRGFSPSFNRGFNNGPSFSRGFHGGFTGSRGFMGAPRPGFSGRGAITTRPHFISGPPRTGGIPISRAGGGAIGGGRMGGGRMGGGRR